MNSISIPASANTLSIQGIARDQANLEALSLTLPSGSLLLLENQRSPGGRALLYSLLSESEELLSALTQKPRARYQRLLKWTEISGLKPALLLPLPGSTTLSGTLGMASAAQSLLESLFRTQGQYFCEKCQKLATQISPSELARTLIKAQSSLPSPASSLLLGELEETPTAALEARIKELSNSGLRRVFISGNYLRLSNQALSETDAKTLHDLTRSKKKTQELFLVHEALSIGSLSEESLAKTLQLSGLSRNVVHLKYRLLAGALSGHWLYHAACICPTCKKEFPASPEEERDLSLLRLRDKSMKAYLEMDLARLVQVLPELQSNLQPYLDVGFASKTLSTDLRQLSSGEKILFTWASCLNASYQDLLLCAEAMLECLDVEFRVRLLKLFSQLATRGNSILLACEKGVSQELKNPQAWTKPARVEVVEIAGQETEPERKKLAAKLAAASGVVLLQGASGSGKSRLLQSLLDAAPEKGKKKRRPRPLMFSALDYLSSQQAPRAKSALKNLATELGLAEPLSELLASLPEARRRARQARSLRFDAPENLCPSCYGTGRLLQLRLTESEQALCELCLGAGFSEEFLEFSYRGKSPAELLSLPLTQALSLFQHHEALANPLEVALLFGLREQTLSQTIMSLCPADLLRAQLARRFGALGQTSDCQLLLLDDVLDFFSAEERTALVESVLECAPKASLVVLTTRLGGAGELRSKSSHNFLPEFWGELFF